MIKNLPTEIYNDVKNAIITIAEGLKVPAEMLLTTIVKQGVVESISNLSLMLFFMILSIIMIKTFLPMWKEYANSHSTSDGEDFRTITTMAVTVIILITFFCFTITNIKETITGFINPEYRAIELILNMIKK